MTRAWDRQLWGVEFASQGDRMLIGDAWLRPMHPGHYDGEPTRALVFCTRKQARDWCATRQKEYAGRTDCCAEWRFRAVRVRERVECS